MGGKFEAQGPIKNGRYPKYKDLVKIKLTTTEQYNLINL